MSSPTHASGEKTYKIFPAGPDFQNTHTLLGKFPGGLPSFNKGSWTFREDQQEVSRFRRDPLTGSRTEAKKRWRLDQSGVKQLVGNSLVSSDVSSNYFALIPGENGTLMAVPLEQWVQFRPKERKQDMKLLEEVEKEMEEKEKMAADLLKYLRPKSLAQEEEGGGTGGAKAGATDPDDLWGSDDDDDGVSAQAKKKTNKSKSAKASGKKAKEVIPVNSDEEPEDLDENVPDDALRPERPQDAEDWEHEDNRDDDDQDMGQDEDQEVQQVEREARKKLGLDEEEEELDEDTKKMREAIDQAKKEEGDVSSSDDEPEPVEVKKEEVEEEEDDKDVDLDKMAEELEEPSPAGVRAPSPAPSRQSTPGANPPRPADSKPRAASGAARPPSQAPKRKAPTPPPDGGAKKQRTDSARPPAAARGGDSRRPSGAAASGAPHRQATPPANFGTFPSDGELLEMVRRSRHTVKTFTAEMKKRLQMTEEDKNSIRAAVLRLFTREKDPKTGEMVLKPGTGLGAGGAAATAAH